MKSKHLLILSIVFLTGCTREAAIAPDPEISFSPAPVRSVSPTKSMASVAIEPSGTFVSGEHNTQGTVRILTENGNRYLELDSTFQTSTSGPDLYVILHRSNDVIGSTTPPAYPLQEQDYVIIDRLQAYSGAQRYQIPDDIDLAQYKSAVIWCRMFNATFGAARLDS